MTVDYIDQGFDRLKAAKDEEERLNIQIEILLKAARKMRSALVEYGPTNEAVEDQMDELAKAIAFVGFYPLSKGKGKR